MAVCRQGRANKDYTSNPIPISLFSSGGHAEISGNSIIQKNRFSNVCTLWVCRHYPYIESLPTL